MRCTPETGGWGNGDGHAFYTVYFHAEFDKPFISKGFWCADIPDILRNEVRMGRR